MSDHEHELIVISGTISFVDRATRDAAVAASVDLQADTRASAPGCLAYVFTADPVVETAVHVYEAWTDAASLAGHFAGPRYAAMRALLRSFERGGPSSVAKHAVTRSQPVYDPTGRPRADWFDA